MAVTRWRIGRLVLLTTLAAGLPTLDAAACVDGNGCNQAWHNGLCISGVCKCDPGWTGATCSRLNLGPTPESTNDGGRVYPPRESNTSRSVLIANCQLDFCQPSTAACSAGRSDPPVMPAHPSPTVSSTLHGVYTPRDQIMPPFAHNAMPHTMPGGVITIWHVGSGTPNTNKPFIANCTNGTTPLPKGPEQAGDHSSGPWASGGSSTSKPYAVPTANSPGGPWTSTGITFADGQAHGLSNPSPVVLPNGTTYLVTRGSAMRNSPGEFKILVAPHWSGPYRPANGNWTTPEVVPEVDHGCEDGFLFADP
eukprot:gene10656-1938_t